MMFGSGRKKSRTMTNDDLVAALISCPVIGAAVAAGSVYTLVRNRHSLVMVLFCGACLAFIAVLMFVAVRGMLVELLRRRTTSTMARNREDESET